MCVITGERKSAAFSCPFHREVKVQNHAHNGTTASDNFSVLSGADDANMGLEHRLQCIAMPGYMDYAVDLNLYVILLKQMSYAV